MNAAITIKRQGWFDENLLGEYPFYEGGTVARWPKILQNNSKGAAKIYVIFILLLCKYILKYF